MFPLACRNNLQGRIFLKEINKTACVFPSYDMFICCKKMYSQNDEKSILEVLMIIVCCYETMMGRTLQNFSVHFRIQ